MRGKLIVFEGGEGSGKTTQIQALYDWLSQSEALKRLRAQGRVAGIQLTREPGGTPLGQQIRHLLLSASDAPMASSTELLLYAADRAQHVAETLVPWLDQGYWVLCDRYTDSTVAYQGYGRQLDLTLIDQLNQIATRTPAGPLKSDLTLWLNVSPTVGLARMHRRAQADRIEQAGVQFHQRVADGFAAIATPDELGRANPYSSGPTVEIKGDRPASAVAAQIQQVLQQRLAQWYPLLSQL